MPVYITDYEEKMLKKCVEALPVTTPEEREVRHYVNIIYRKALKDNIVRRDKALERSRKRGDNKIQV